MIEQNEVTEGQNVDSDVELEAMTRSLMIHQSAATILQLVLLLALERLKQQPMQRMFPRKYTLGILLLLTTKVSSIQALWPT